MTGVQITGIEWAGLTTLIGAGSLIVGYLINNWKKGIEEKFKKLFSVTENNQEKIEEEVDKMKADSARCKLSIANDFVRVKEYDKTTIRIENNIQELFSKFDGLVTLMNTQHTQVMYELGVRNGKRTGKN